MKVKGQKKPKVIRVKIICMECGKVTRTETWTVGYNHAAYNDPNPTSTGVCDNCYIKAIRES